LARKFKKFNIPPPLKINNVIAAAILCFAAWGSFNWLQNFIATSPYFKLKKVEIILIGRVPLSKSTVKDLLENHKGSSIFEIDLPSAKGYILSHYPEIRMLSINRVFPDKLVLYIRPRKPVAQANLPFGFYLLDAEGVVLPGIRGLAAENLPMINGIELRSFGSMVGKRCNYPGLGRALRLLEVINQTKFSQDHEIHMIDIADEKNLSLYIEGGIEIKIGREDFRNRLSALTNTFDSGRLDKNQVKYIDLRFGDVIIGPR